MSANDYPLPFDIDSRTEAGQPKLKKISGKVTDEKGEPIPGTTVVVEGQSRGVITDTEGNFEIEVEPAGSLQFSVVGMVSQIIQVGDKTIIDVKLQSKLEELDEVSVVAFGNQKKESVIGSISTISVKELKSPSSNLTNSFAGLLAGVVSYQRSGEPGSDNASFFIRGVTSFGYKKDLLILIDHIELTFEDLARIQPDDIKSFSIMKDATATALYGARGANGVILVKTKHFCPR